MPVRLSAAVLVAIAVLAVGGPLYMGPRGEFPLSAAHAESSSATALR